MTYVLKNLLIRSLTGLVASIIFWGVFMYLPHVVFSVLLSACAIFIVLVEWRQFPAFCQFLTPVYPLLPFFLLVLLNHHHHALLYYLFIMVFAHDTGSYVVGISLGRTKLAPTISPNKTWEGAVGGFVATLLAVYALTHWFHVQRSLLTLVSFAFVVSVLALAGDLFESWLKRKAALKNAGSLLPGHGGLLDRFDSILSTTFFFYVMRTSLALLLL